MEERSGIVTFKGNPVTLLGPALKVGDKAPDFQAVDTALNPVSLADFRGKTKIICAVPSLNTPVCDTETRRFNQEAATLGGGVQVLCVSADLPFAQARWCGAAGIKNVRTLSDHREMSFGTAYGVLLKDLRLLTRAIFIVDAEGVLRYQQIVPEMTSEPSLRETSMSSRLRPGTSTRTV